MSDDLYKRILDSLYDGVYLVDPDRRITYWNWGADRLMLASKTAGRNRVSIGDLPGPG